MRHLLNNMNFYNNPVPNLYYIKGKNEILEDKIKKNLNLLNGKYKFYFSNRISLIYSIWFILTQK